MHWLEHVRFIIENDIVTQGLLAGCCAAALVYVALIAACKLGGLK